MSCVGTKPAATRPRPRPPLHRPRSVRYSALIRAHQRVLDPTTRPRHRRRPRAKPSLAPSGARTVPRASQPRYLSTSYLLVCYLLPRVARVPSLVRPSTFASADAPTCLFVVSGLIGKISMYFWELSVVSVDLTQLARGARLASRSSMRRQVIRLAALYMMIWEHLDGTQSSEAFNPMASSACRRGNKV